MAIYLSVHFVCCTLLSLCPSVVTLPTAGKQDRAVFFYLHPLRQEVIFPMSPQGSGRKPTDQHYENPHVISTKHMVQPGLYTQEVSCLFPSPLNLISRFLVTCLSQELYVSCPSRRGSSHTAYPAPTAQLSLTNSL